MKFPRLSLENYRQRSAVKIAHPKGGGPGDGRKRQEREAIVPNVLRFFDRALHVFFDLIHSNGVHLPEFRPPKRDEHADPGDQDALNFAQKHGNSPVDLGGVCSRLCAPRSLTETASAPTRAALLPASLAAV